MALLSVRAWGCGLQSMGCGADRGPIAAASWRQELLVRA